MKTTRMLGMRVGVVVGLVTVSVLAADPPLGQLIYDLQGPDLKARAAARQFLVRRGAAAVPELMPLLSSKDAALAGSAMTILMDIGDRVSAPGGEDERRAVAKLYVQLLSPDRSREERILGLRLFERMAPVGWDMETLRTLGDHFKAMLSKDDPILRDKARTAMQRMGTPIARAGLRALLRDSEPAFQVALLNSLGELEDEKALPQIVELTTAGDPSVRAAAARALAWTGDPALLKVVREAMGRADGATRAESWDALVRLLNAMEKKGGNWQTVVEAYLDLLAKGEGVFKDAALAGLGRIGDGTCVKPVIASMSGADPRTRLTAIRALGTMQGVDVAVAIAAEYPKLDAEAQVALLPWLGAKRVPQVLPLLKEAARSQTPAFRLAGLRGLAEAREAQARDVLTEAVRSGGPEERAIAQRGLLGLAGELRDHGKKGEAAVAYLTVCQTATGTPIRAKALDGLAGCPTAAAFEVVMACAGDADLREPATRALVAVAGALVAGGQKDKALAAYEKVQGLSPSYDAVRTIVAQMKKLGTPVDVAALLGTVTRWWVIGPFELGEQNKGWDTDFIGEGKPVDLKKTQVVGNTSLAWKPFVSQEETGKIVLRPALADRDQCIAYAYTEISVEKDVDVVFKMGVDDSEKVWVNGQKVFDHFVARPWVMDQDTVPVRLKAGVNTILLKIYQNAMGWEFNLRIARPDGVPMKFVQKAE